MKYHIPEKVSSWITPKKGPLQNHGIFGKRGKSPPDLSIIRVLKKRGNYSSAP